MEMESLRLVVQETDINDALDKWGPKDTWVRGLRAQVTPEGIRILGKLKGILPVGIQLSVWAEAGKALIRVDRVKGFFGLGKGRTLREIRRKIDGKVGISMVDRVVTVEPDRLLALAGIRGHTNLAALRTESGRLVIECGRHWEARR